MIYTLLSTDEAEWETGKILVAQVEHYMNTIFRPLSQAVRILIQPRFKDRLQNSSLLLQRGEGLAPFSFLTWLWQSPQLTGLFTELL